MASSFTVGRPTDVAAPSDKTAPPDGATVLYLPASSRDRSAVRDRLTRSGVAVTAAADITEALQLLSARRFALCLLDLADDRAAIGAIRVLRTRHAQLPLAAIIDPANPFVAGEALDAGAIDLLPWPFDERDVLVVLAGAHDRGAADAAPNAAGADTEPLFAQSAAMQSVVELVRAAAEVRGGVIVSGEPGSGRELIARAIHRCSEHAADHPLVTVDCAGDTPQDLERRLFGVAADRKPSDGKPPVTDRVTRSGAIAQAIGGTLILTNLVEAPARVQDRLARLLRDREAMLADKRTIIELDVRPIAVFDPMVEAAVTDGRLRRDLYERLTQVQIDVPPLRRRREDIPALAVHFLRKAGESQGASQKSFSRSALTLLAALPWHGNARELQQMVGTLIRSVRRPVIQLDDLLDQASLESLAARVDPGLTLREAKARFERDCISAVLMRHHGRVGEAAKALGIQRTNLYRKVRQLNVARSLLSPRK
ncbi:MAG TPA: sigma 54-interacting transcriptional regulator [Vicinamibacterales bacterium]|nr:sigma 54-interacting transcriptional regulator [Vicinamibacterales bacterium]